jgi:dTDP-4-dehydrorhamnose 3,5-epimerase-like enzyme
MAAAEPFELTVHRDERGSLVSIEGQRDVPFAIARVYYIVASDGSARGFHAHRRLEQLMICVHGGCRITLDDGQARSEHVLDRPDTGLFIGRMTWREMHDFSGDCVLLVIASAAYDEGDYIRDYDEFRREGAKRDGG